MQYQPTRKVFCLSAYKHKPHKQWYYILMPCNTFPTYSYFAILLLFYCSPLQTFSDSTTYWRLLVTCFLHLTLPLFTGLLPVFATFYSFPAHLCHFLLFCSPSYFPTLYSFAAHLWAADVPGKGGHSKLGQFRLASGGRCGGRRRGQDVGA